MTPQEIVPGLFWIKLFGVNVYALKHEDGVVLIDTGFGRSTARLRRAIGDLGPLEGIVVTHAHADHAGSLAALGQDAPTWMHERDADMVARGDCNRPELAARTGMIGVFRVLARPLFPDRVTPHQVTHHVRGGDTIPLAGGLAVHEMPGHSAGQIALMWHSPNGPVLFAADVVTNMGRLAEPPLYEDATVGRASIRALARLAAAADLMVFGHGAPLKDPGAAMNSFAAAL